MSRTLLLIVALAFTASAQQRPEVYTAQCAVCHGANLNGGDEAPPLTGAKFLAKWRGRPAGALAENIRTTMPADHPGTLSPAIANDLAVWLLAAGKVTTPPPPTPAVDPPPSLVEGRAVQSLPPEKSDNQPAFPQQTRAPYHASATFKVTTLADNMPAPFGLAFLPGGNILITHKLPGSIHILRPNGKLSGPVTGVSQLISPGAKDIGLLDVAPDLHYATNHRIFFTFFEYIDGTDSNTCVARGTLDETTGALTEGKVIFRAIPAIPSKRLGSKTGGRIALAPDGTIFFSTGDRSDSPPWDVSQRLDSHLGKILHITADGAPAPDNPFLHQPGVLPEIWAYGVRNPEGLAFDPATGRLWENEHGPRGGDELNIIEKGKNYGWPVITHGIDYPGNAIGTGITHQAGMEEPVYYWDPVIAPSGLVFYTGTLFPQWKGSLFVGGLRAAMLVRLTLDNDRVTAEEPLLTDLHTRIRDVRVGPDGAVYVLTDSGTATMSANSAPGSKLLKLTPR